MELLLDLVAISGKNKIIGNQEDYYQDSRCYLFTKIIGDFRTILALKPVVLADYQLLFKNQKQQNYSSMKTLLVFFESLIFLIP